MAYTYNYINFTYTGGAQSWVVPTGLYRIYVDMAGAQGGTGYNVYGGSSGGGGKGARLVTTLSVTPGEVLYFYTGGRGLNGSETWDNGGWNGGGTGGHLANVNGGGGGGATDIRRGGEALANRILVAGGGGGGGANDAGANGEGGGYAGATGNPGGSGARVSGGGGGTLSSGGSAGGPDGNVTVSTSGSLGQGGVGAASTGAGQGGGGGAGYYGGGGGGTRSNSSEDDGGGGGGGGSSYDSTGVGTITANYQSSNGYVSIIPLYEAFRYANNGTVYKILGEVLSSQKLRVRKNGVTIGIPLVDTTDPLASPIRIYDGSAVKSLPKLII